MLGEEPSRRPETERSSALTIVPQRRLRPLGRGSSSGGIIATVAVHAGLVALIYFAHVQLPPPVEVPRDFLVTRLVSGNQYFDDSCLQAIRDTHQVPPPPAGMRERFERGTLLEFTGKDMARRGDA